MQIGMREHAFYTAYYSQLVGCTVVKAELVADGEGLWPTLTMQRPDGTTFDVELSQDPEGNGPGFMFGLERPRPEGALSFDEVEAAGLDGTLRSM